jgi:molecular chaperone GrpE
MINKSISFIENYYWKSGFPGGINLQENGKQEVRLEEEQNRPDPEAGENAEQNAKSGGNVEGGLPEQREEDHSTGPAGGKPGKGQVDVEQLQKELAEQKQRAEEYFNRLVRLQADFDNFRKRVQREREEFFKYASASLCEMLLPVLDNFQLALAAKNEDPAKVVAGVEMIYRQLEEVLQKEGLTPVAAVGEVFDPTKHEAVMREETEEYPDNTVIEELRRGYYLKDRLIRPAMVKVATKSGS